MADSDGRYHGASGGHQDGSSPYDVFEDRGSYHKNHHGLDQERSRTRDMHRERDKDRERYPSDKNRSLRDEKARDKSDHYSHRRSHEDNRHYDHDRYRERTNRDRSSPGSRNKSRSRYRSRSSSPSRSKSKRTSGFDMAPPAAAMLPGATVSGVLPATSGTVQNAFSFETAQMSAFPLMPVQAMTQQATRHARRVYVGGLPPAANEQTIATFFSHVMAAIGGNSASPGDAVVNVYINNEKKFAFVEMRTVEEASNAMALDGIVFEGVSVRVKRPTDYNPSLAAVLGPSQPSPHLNLAAVGLSPGLISGATGGVEGPDRIFIGGLPYYFTEEQIRELLESFGPLRGFDLVKDRDTGNSKGYGFCVYQDPASTDVACAALNGLKMGDKTLTVRRATANTGQVKSDQDNILAQAQQHIAMQKMALEAGGVDLPGLGVPLPPTAVEIPSKVLCLAEAISVDELRDDEEYGEILHDMKDECGKFGTLLNVVIPRPISCEQQSPGVGKVFLEYSDSASSAKAKNALDGRKFGGNTVRAAYYSEEKFYSGDYGE